METFSSRASILVTISRDPAKLPRRRLTANMEDYLEPIYTLSTEGGAARVSALAGALGVKPPSVSKALGRLQRDGLVTHSPYGGAALTSRGRDVAAAQVRTHGAIVHFLEKVLLLDNELAEHDACLIEPAISSETVERLAAFSDHLERHGAKVAASFRRSLGNERAGKGPAQPRRRWISKV